MAQISVSDIKKLADLACMELTESEITALASELDLIVAAVDKVNQAVFDNVEVTTHPVEISNVSREDVVLESLPVEVALSQAFDVSQNMFKVPTILSES